MAAEHDAGGDIGGQLRAARQRRGVSLRQVAHTTKISVSALEALERNDVSRLPGGLFSRAFVRAYALEVGLDPERAIEDFLAQFPHESVIAGHPKARDREDRQGDESNRRIASAFLWLMLMSVPLVGLVMYFGRGSRGPVEPPPRADVAEFAGRAAQPPPPAVDPLDVVVSATGVCRLMATVDGSQTIEREMQPGDRQVLRGLREIVLTVSDAGVLRTTLNGVPARSFGAPGEAATVRLTPANFFEFLDGQ